MWTEGGAHGVAVRVSVSPLFDGVSRLVDQDDTVHGCILTL